MHDLVGREPELAAIDAALTRARSGATVLRIEGEAGIGKSALVDLAVRRTIASGSRVLACRPVPSEARLAFASLPEIDTLGTQRVTHLHLGPLSLSATFQVLRGHGVAPTSRPTLRRIHDLARGNPLVAIELARTIHDQGDQPGRGSSGTTAQSVPALFARRIARTGAEGRLAMLIVALAAGPAEVMVDAVDGAAARRVEDLVADGPPGTSGRVRFTHPLLGEAVIASFDATAIRAMRGRLAAVTPEPERRVRHRALAADAPDPVVAAELEAVAANVAHASAEAACELLELAIAATPAGDPLHRRARSLALARLLVRAGDNRGATAALDDLLAGGEADVLRAQALDLRAAIDWVAGRSDVAIQRCAEGFRIADLDPWTRARLAVTRARLTMDPDAALPRVRFALRLLDRLPVPDPALRVEAITALGGAQAAVGDVVDAGIVEEALALEAVAPPANVSDRFSAALGVWLKYQGRLRDARRWLRGTLETAIAEGDEGSLPYALSHLPQLELWTGEWLAAEQAAREHFAVAEWKNSG